MDFLEALDRAFGFKVVFEEDPRETMSVLDRNVWMTMDPDLLKKIAYTGSKKQFWAALAELGQDIDDPEILAKVKQATDAENPSEDVEFLKNVRREAKKYAGDRAISAPSHLGPTEKLGMSKDEIDAYYAARRAEREKTKKKYVGDEMYGVFDKASGKMLRGNFYNDKDAKSFMVSELPPGGDYEVKLYENPKSLSKLKDLKLPLQHGWSADEVVEGFMPWIRYLSWKYRSDKAEFEDLLQQGALGVLDALRTDKGEAPIGSHAWRHILGSIRRYALTGGVMRGGEKSGGFKQSGALVGYEISWTDASGQQQKEFFPADISALAKGFSPETGRTPPSTMDPGYRKAEAFKGQLIQSGVPEDKIQLRERRGAMASADAPMRGGEGEASLGSTLKATRAKKPAYVAQQKDLVKKLIDRAKLSDKQRKVLEMTFGLDVPEAGLSAPGAEGAHPPGEQAGGAPEASEHGQMGKVHTTGVLGGSEERGPTEIARILGLTPKAVRELRDRALLAIHRAAQEMSGELQQRGLIQKPEELAATEALLKKVNIIEEIARHHLVLSIVTGEINCMFG